MSETNHLFGSCACQRNQYTILVNRTSSPLPQVFFDNSTSYRRTQATPITAWLRVPLAHYHSTTHALFPDESHSAIKRTFHTPASSRKITDPPVRRQFCGFCGTHLTAWEEGGTQIKDRAGGSEDWLDVTLGSLEDESLERLEELGILPDSSSDDSSAYETEGTDRTPAEEEPDAMVPRTTSTRPPHRMTSRGIPYFEELVEHSRFGRIKRQVGGHTSRDGTMSVRWEVTEIDGMAGGDDEEMPDSPELRGSVAKRQRVDS
ncbi:unnamed protein product [Zymoseptoria tritici ST99CH_3D1]|uniref:CENP-V/GFA domain-containing protein n=2 Tax=Zymoseptoria tritici TaxID=1047171 RepID=F9X8Z3_ZYMTI|nr:uncharacterized protein MYCGRDRAFT_41318 [Zymoseptoria tritici IPO323]EGP88444.1 hypothetical protein MYCGRDRAFT_41318 [Zymoseptoria tritici IPO323]SMR50804.1 unnamed protein product [Zymoseptoria tritici ST99CH_1E4]SMR51744.1 unnamed protein product [Zymoseptoria tritici ST99CH_3D1]